MCVNYDARVRPFSLTTPQPTAVCRVVYSKRCLVCLNTQHSVHTGSFASFMLFIWGTVWYRIHSFSSDLDDTTYCQVGQDIKADLIILCFWKQANCTRERFFPILVRLNFHVVFYAYARRCWHRLEPGQSAFRARLVPRRTAVTMSSLTSDTA